MEPETVAAGETISNTIVEELYNKLAVSQDEIEPLYESIDPDALDSLFSGNRTGEVRFTHSGYEILVRDGEVVSLEPVAEK